MEADPLQTADDYFACCAHQRVNYNPIRNGDGTMSARWTCALCIHEFVPKAALIAKHAEVADANAEIDRLNAPVCSNCLLSEDIAGVSINTDCGQEYETICAKCQADPNVTDYVVHENAYEAFIATRRELEEKHAEVGRLREALTHLDRILAFSPVSHQTREFVRATLAQEAGKCSRLDAACSSEPRP